MDELRTIPTCTLIDELCKADKEGNQKLVNIYAYELAYRIYIPNDEITFEKILTDFGYKKIEEEKILTKKR